MLTNILDYLVQTVSWLPEKIAVWDDTQSLTFRQLLMQANAVGSYLMKRGISRRGVAVLLKRKPEAVSALLGVVKAGSFFAILDPEEPQALLSQKLELLNPAIVLCEGETAALTAGWPTAFLTEALTAPITEEADRLVRTDGEPACAQFVPGADGTPKAVLLSQRNLLENTDHLGAALKCSSNSRFGCIGSLADNLTELLLSLKYGGSCYLLPALPPLETVDALNAQEINTLLWRVTDLTAVSEQNTVYPRHLTTVGAYGSAFPIRQLCLWQKALPQTAFWNLYGCAETGGSCCAFPANRRFALDESLPMGKPFPNTEILLLDEAGRPANTGEICIRGSCLAMGYLNSPQPSGFTANPAAPAFPERIFRTGDYGTRNAQGDLIFLGRKDSRLSFRSRRLEPGQIESAALSHPAIRSACCQLDEKTGRLQLFFTGLCSCQELSGHLSKLLPHWMLPRSFYRLEFMPLTASGTIDRRLLKKNAGKGVYAYQAG